ncbi:hypothetical protein DMA11_01775 [Marinilabiliaceae bacterium JC017]|nr:hypothetical protein DMA11_01775 [Marinilabiliaceae bacterium JC017]
MVVFFMLACFNFNTSVWGQQATKAADDKGMNGVESNVPVSQNERTSSHTGDVFTDSYSIFQENIFEQSIWENICSIRFPEITNVVYQPFDEISVSLNEGKRWKWFEIPDFSMEYGAFIDKYQNDVVMLETYQKPVVCDPGTHNVTFLKKGRLIGAASHWEAAGAYPDLHVVASDTYEVWKGRRGYVGVKLWKTNGRHEKEYYYGYFELEVSADGTSYKILGAAYNPVPGESIVAGETACELLFSNTEWYESDDNDGSITNHANIRLLSDEFAVAKGLLMQKGKHFSVTGVPDGLSISIFIVDGCNAIMYANGKALSNEYTDSCEMTIGFNDEAFKGGDASAVAYTKRKINVHFRDEYQIVYVDVDDFTVSEDNPWQLYQLGYRGAAFGVWYDNDLKTCRFEIYEDDGVSYGEERNLVPLAKGEIIHKGMNWVAGGNFPKEHNISTADFSEWHGREGYVAMRFHFDEQCFYGWAHIKVAVDGQSYTLLDYAFNEKPGAPLITGDGQKKVKESILMVN